MNLTEMDIAVLVFSLLTGFLALGYALWVKKHSKNHS